MSTCGPLLRASGVKYDVRRADPYSIYPELDFDVPVGMNGDIYDRYRVRMDEFIQSNSIVRQCVEQIPEGPIMADAPKFTLPAKDKVLTDMEHLILDSTVVRAHPCAAGAPKKTADKARKLLDAAGAGSAPRST